MIKPHLDEQQLVDEEVIDLLIKASQVKPDETVVEIGPGMGNITEVLLERAGKVVAVEKNPKFVSILRDRFGDNPKLEIMNRDALLFQFPPHHRLVSNLPYMISEPLLHKLFRVDFCSASFIVSKGFGNLVSSDDPSTKLSYLSRIMFDSTIIMEVSPDAYLPPPHVSTVIITLTHRKPVDDKMELLQAIFRQEDKKTINAIREALIQTGKAETKRGAKKIIRGFHIPQPILETPVARLSLTQIRELGSFLKFTEFTVE